MSGFRQIEYKKRHLSLWVKIFVILQRLIFWHISSYLFLYVLLNGILTLILECDWKMCVVMMHEIFVG